MRVTVHIPDGLGCKAKEIAHDEGLSLSALTAKALEEYLRQKRKRTAGNRLLELIRPDSVTPDAWDELEKSRLDDRLDTRPLSNKVVIINLRKTRQLKA